MARFKKELITTGTWERPGAALVMDVTQERMDEWVRKFYEMKTAGIKVPFPYDHSYDPRENAGFVTELKREGESLYAVIEVPREEDAKLMGTVIQDVSISVNPNFVDGTGRKWGEVIEHVAATNYPVVSGQGNFVEMARRKEQKGSGVEEGSDGDEVEVIALRKNVEREPQGSGTATEEESGTQELRKDGEQLRLPEMGPQERSGAKEVAEVGLTGRTAVTSDQLPVISDQSSVSSGGEAEGDGETRVDGDTETRGQGDAEKQRMSNIERRMSKDEGKRQDSGTARTDSISNIQHSMSNDQGAEDFGLPTEGGAPRDEERRQQIQNAKSEMQNRNAQEQGGELSQNVELAREVRRLREREVEREIKDLLCDGKITPAQAGMARVLLGFRVRGSGFSERKGRMSNIECRMSNDEVNDNTDDGECRMDVAEVFREFLAAMPRGAAVDFEERTRGVKGLEHGLQASRGTPEDKHEELARENLELVGKGGEEK
jgi:hypothetical protein